MTNRPGSRTQVENKGLCIKVQPDDDQCSLPNIPEQCRLEDGQWSVCIVPSDDFDACFLIMVNEMSKRQGQGERLIADYTGGTKTMTAALAVASLELPDVELRMVGGARGSLNRVDDGTQYSVVAQVENTRVDRAVKLNLAHWKNGHYAAAADGLAAMAAPNDSVQRIRWVRARTLSEAFTAWDRFDHRRALELLSPFQPVVAPMWPALWNAIGLLGDAASSDRQTALRLWDLLLNARRRAAQMRFDDAVARVYRLLEWTAQWQLECCMGWSTADLPLEIASQFQITPGPQGRHQTGLRGAWEILARHVPGPASEFYLDQGEAMLELLLKRNQSILAHGFSNVSEADWQIYEQFLDRKFEGVLKVLIKMADQRQLFDALPKDYPLAGPGEQSS